MPFPAKDLRLGYSWISQA